MTLRILGRLALSCVILAATACAARPLGVPAVFGDNMVLQAGRRTPVWGWAAPGEKVVVRVVGGATAEGVTDADGRWAVKFDELRPSAEPVTVTIQGAATTLTFRNVLVGDVWVGSGQSNMEWGVSGALRPKEEIAAAAYPKIRLFKAPQVRAGQPRSDLPLGQGGARRGPLDPNDVVGRWVECSPATVGKFPAVLYFFGREVHQESKRPVGLLASCLGGTHIEGWMPRQAVDKDRSLKDLRLNVEHAERTYRSALPGRLDELERWTTAGRAAAKAGLPLPPPPKGVTPPAGTGDALLAELDEFDRFTAAARKALKDNAPLPEVPAGLPQIPPSVGGNYLFNGMVAPLIPFGVRGVLWYQGENNGNEGDTYFVKQKALIETWRELWGRGDLPFYFVQLPQYDKAADDPAGGDGWSKLREAQRKVLATVPHTGMAVTIDVGDPKNIHPANKQDVAARLARWALRNEYGQKDVVPSGPLYKGMAVEGGRIRITFDHVGAGLMVGHKKHLEPATEVKGGALKRFAIAGPDRQWHWADAAIDGDAVVVSSPAAPNPVAVRYAYANNPDGANLYNRDGLPASPFRTDDW